MGNSNVLEEALAGFPSLKRHVYADDSKPPRDLGDVQADMRTAAGDALDHLARQRMTMFPGETYRDAMRQTMDAHPDLKSKYIKGE